MQELKLEKEGQSNVIMFKRCCISDITCLAKINRICLGKYTVINIGTQNQIKKYSLNKMIILYTKQENNL